MEYEKLIKAENITVEDMTGGRFLASTPSTGLEVIGRINNRLYVYGWAVEDPEEDWNGHGELGERVDAHASLVERKPIILEGFGEWLPEEGVQNV